MPHSGANRRSILGLSRAWTGHAARSRRGKYGAIAAVNGIGGIGKSALALRLARQLPRDVETQRDLAVSFYKLAHLANQTEQPDEAGALLHACYQQLERMRAAGMPLDSAFAQLHQQLAGIFGQPGGTG